MKKTLLAVTLAALTSGAATTALAADPKAPAPDFEISGNFGLFSDYRFRGISQTNTKPAVQGGFDLAHKSGLYAGTWASNVSQWANPGGSMEVDFYVGYGTELPMGVGVDVGHTWYTYPGNEPGNNPAVAVSNDTREFHIGFSYSVLNYKYSRASTTWFGIPGSKGSDYHSVGLEFSPSENLVLSASAGNQKVKRAVGQGENSFKDYSLSASYDLGNDYSIGLSYHWVSLKDAAAKAAGTTATAGWFGINGATTTKAISDNGAVISLSKTF
jgi:uncharacterized protein (TIGR02001 family)